MIDVKKYLIVSLIIIPIVFFSACSQKNKSDISIATIQQIQRNSVNSTQSNALYYFEKNKLNVLIVFSPFQSPDTDPSDSDFKEKFRKDLEVFNKSFPSDVLTEEEYQSEFEKEFKNVTFKMNETAKEVVIKGKNVEKTFKMSDSNDKRLIDSLGNEYELIIDKK